LHEVSQMQLLKRTWFPPFLFLLPGVLIFFLMIISPAVQSVWISFHSWDGMGPMQWVGIENYKELLTDKQFFLSLKNNVIWVFIFSLAPVVGLMIALLVNQSIRGMKVAKSLFFTPLVLAPAAVGVIFVWFYDPSFGVLAKVSQGLGLETIALLSSETWVTFAVVVAAIWPQVAFCMILYLAGLSNVDESVISAARVDGAKGLRMLYYIVLPQLHQVSFLAIAVSVIAALRSFDVIAVMTQGGPFGSSATLAYQMYEQSIFSYRFGYGAAIATVLFVGVSLFIAWYLNRLLKNESVS
jgi:multiple sugar transport system permease protein